MEKLYNGIVLDGEWPPRYDLEKDREEIKVPYLENPPETINIDIGRQLFVDDFLIENTNLEKVYHEAQKFSENPVLRAESALEKAENFSLPSAAPKGGGVWYDEERKKFRIESLPGSLAEALVCMKNSLIIKQALGAHILDEFLTAKEIEWDKFRTYVSEWEIERYLARY